jgi:hypothetical protein
MSVSDEGTTIPVGTEVSIHFAEENLSAFEGLTGALLEETRGGFRLVQLTEEQVTGAIEAKLQQIRDAGNYTPFDDLMASMLIAESRQAGFRIAVTEDEITPVAEVNSTVQA